MGVPSYDDVSSGHIFNHVTADSPFSHTCPTSAAEPTIPLLDSWTFQHIAALVSGICGLITLVLAGIITIRHVRTYSIPKQQKQIIRVAWLVPLFSVISFLMIWAREHGLYIEPAKTMGEAFAVAGMMLLMTDYVFATPGGAVRMVEERTGRTQKWLKTVWYLVLQLIPMSATIWVVTAITVATDVYCKQSFKPQFAHIWMTIFTFLSTCIALGGLVRFYCRAKQELKPHRFLSQFLAFFGLIAVTTLQTLIIGILLSAKVIYANQYLSYGDINEVLPALIISCEMPFFAALFLWVFSTKPFQLSSEKQEFSEYRGGRFGWRAIFDVINVVDILFSFVEGPTMLVRKHERNASRGASPERAALVAPSVHVYGPVHHDGLGLHYVPVHHQYVPITPPMRTASPSPAPYGRQPLPTNWI